MQQHCYLPQVRYKSRFWLHCHFSFLDFSLLSTTFENLKSAIGGEFLFLSNWRFRFGSYNTRDKFIQNIAIFKFCLHCILFSLMFEILLEYNCYLYHQLNRNTILHRSHILDFQMLSWEKRNQRKKNGNVVRTLNWNRPVPSLTFRSKILEIWNAVNYLCIPVFTHWCDYCMTQFGNRQRIIICAAMRIY